MHLRWGGIINDCNCKFPEERYSEGIVKICQYLTKLCVDYVGLLFLAHPVYFLSAPLVRICSSSSQTGVCCYTFGDSLRSLCDCQQSSCRRGQNELSIDWWRDQASRLRKMRSLSSPSASLFTQPPSGKRRMRICFADVFFVFFCFFFVRQKYETTILGNGWTDFHETFTKRYRGKCLAKVVPPPGEWRMLIA